MQFTYDNIEYNIPIWFAGKRNDMFHDIVDLSPNWLTWEPTIAPKNLFHGHGDGFGGVNSGFDVHSYNKKPDTRVS